MLLVQNERTHFKSVWQKTQPLRLIILLTVYTYEAHALFNVRDQTKPLYVTVSLNDHAVKMQVDTE